MKSARLPDYALALAQPKRRSRQFARVPYRELITVSADYRWTRYAVSLPLRWDRALYNSGGNWRSKHRLVTEHRSAVWSACQKFLAPAVGDPSRVKSVVYWRVGPRVDDDNLVSSWKYARDALCSWLVWGSEAPQRKHKIGAADDELVALGAQWHYGQAPEFEGTKRAMGGVIEVFCDGRPNLLHGRYQIDRAIHDSVIGVIP